MTISRSEDLKLKLGNLFLASMFSIVPTAMTVGFLGVHGYLLCRSLDMRLEKIETVEVKELCMKSNLEANYRYIIWIWIFTMIPTWRWFYIGHYKRVKNQAHNL